MKLGRFDIQPSMKLQVIDDKLAEVNSILDSYNIVCAELDAALERGELDPLMYDIERTGYDQTHQVYFMSRDRLLTQRDRASSRLAKAVLKQKT